MLRHFKSFANLVKTVYPNIGIDFKKFTSQRMSPARFFLRILSNQYRTETFYLFEIVLGGPLT